jgi:putative ABC transport system permease protein
MVASAIRPLGVGAVSAQSYIQDQLNIFNIISLVFGGIGAIALLVAAIGVINTMIMAILERTREIGVLRACGATRRTIRQLFTVEAAALGFIGGVLGVAGGFGLTVLANTFINHQLATNAVSASNIIGLPLWLILTVVGATTAIGTLAGLFPAYRAARLNPIDALRYE